MIIEWHAVGQEMVNSNLGDLGFCGVRGVGGQIRNAGIAAMPASYARDRI